MIFRKINSPFKLKILSLVSLLILTFNFTAISKTGEVEIPIFKEIGAFETTLMAPEDMAKISLEQATKAGFLQNFDIQIANTYWDRAKAEILEAKSVFDTNLESSYELKRDEAEPPSAVFGDQVETRRFNTELSKKLPSGTTLTASYDMEWERSNSVFAVLVPTYDGVTSVSLKQPLLQNFLGLVDRFEIRVSELNFDIRKAETRETIQEQIFQIRSAYWDLVLTFEDLKTQQGGLKISENLLQVGHRRFTLGTIEKADLLNLTSQTRRRMQELLIAEKEVLIKSNALAFLLGVMTDVTFHPKDSLISSVDLGILKNHLHEAFLKRPLLQKAKRDVEQTGLIVTQKANLRLPELDVTATYSMNGLDSDLHPSVKETFGSTSPTYFLGFEFKIPIENRKAHSIFEQARVDQERAKIAFRRTITDVYKQVHDAWIKLDSRVKQKEQTHHIVQLEKEKYLEEERQFKIGRSNSERLRQFQDDWVRARFLDARARRNVLISWDELAKARGTLLEDVGLTYREETK